jgi:hypothetical protein
MSRLSQRAGGLGPLQGDVLIGRPPGPSTMDQGRAAGDWSELGEGHLTGLRDYSLPIPQPSNQVEYR